MSIKAVNLVRLSDARQKSTNGLCVGELTGLSKGGKPHVDFSGNPFEASIEAKILENVSIEANSNNSIGSKVLLFFENGDPGLPIIIGIIQDTVNFALLKQIKSNDKEKKEANTDKKTVNIDAKEEINLRCGKSSISMRKNGRIVVKGVQVTNRASETNKIKGASVSIN